MALFSIQRIEARGRLNTARSALQSCGQVNKFIYTNQLLIIIIFSLAKVTDRHHN